MNNSNLKNILELELGSETEELELMAASCRVPTTTTKYLDDEDLDDLELED